jgi:hypothetical protein
MNARIINAPRPEVMHMLERRMPAEARARLQEGPFNAVGLVQTNLTDLYYFADLAQKASNVFTVELSGSCPQHITTLALFGETSAVHTAIQAIRNQSQVNS